MGIHGIRHHNIKRILFVLFALIVLGYALFEARNMLYGPRIQLLQSEGPIVVHEQTVAVAGTAQNVVSITLGGNPVFIDEEGTFVETRTLSPGLNRLIFEAKDKFGRTTTEILEILYEEPHKHERPDEDSGSITE